jgi:hypothetical protein
MSTTLSLPGLEVIRDARSLYGNPCLVYIDSLDRYPTTVIVGMRRELERLELAGIPAFADGRRVWTPNGSFFIGLDGQPTRVLCSVMDFEDRARHAAQRMAIRQGFSFNHLFKDIYLKEESTHA